MKIALGTDHRGVEAVHRLIAHPQPASHEATMMSRSPRRHHLLHPTAASMSTSMSTKTTMMMTMTIKFPSACSPTEPPA